MPSESAAPREFIVRTVASKPTRPRTYSPWMSADVVTWPGTTSWQTSCTNSGTEISSDGVDLVGGLVPGVPSALRARPM